MDNFLNNPIKGAEENSIKKDQGFSRIFWIIIIFAIIVILVLSFVLFKGTIKQNSELTNLSANKSLNSSQNFKINRSNSGNFSIIKKENKTELNINNSNLNYSDSNDSINNSVVVLDSSFGIKTNSSKIHNSSKLNVSLSDFLKSNLTEKNTSQNFNLTNSTNNSNSQDSLIESRELNLFYQVYYSPSLMSGVYNQYSNSNESLLNPLVTYEIENLENFSITLNFVSEIQGYSLISTDKIKIPAKSNYTLNQNPSLNPGLNLQELTNANLHYKIEMGDSVLQEETIPIKLYAKDTMIWGYYTNDGEFVDSSYWIIAWVTPHTTEIDELIRRSARYHPDNLISGYLCEDCRNDNEWQTYTNKQVKAIYNALKNDYKITYINAPIAYSSNQESSQRVKLPKDSIRLASANCIDGTVLFASALESIGMNPYVEIVPGHAFLCYDINPSGTSYDCLETTMIGSYSFEDAEAYGIYEANEYLNNPEKQLISVADQRYYGVMPIS